MGAVAAAACDDALRFAQERVEACIAEVEWLTHAHWNEVGFYRDLPIDPDFPKYAHLEANGSLRLYTVRVAGHLVGYATYLVGTGLHYAHVMTAQQATLFLHPDYRRGRAGAKFIAYHELMLSAEGVVVLSQHVKVARGFAMRVLFKLLDRLARGFCTLLARRGYELQDLIMTKRLDGGGHGLDRSRG